MKSHLRSSILGLTGLLTITGVVHSVTWDHAHESIPRVITSSEDRCSAETLEEQAAFWRNYDEKFRKAMAEQETRESHACPY